jgi:hypothetical protein
MKEVGDESTKKLTFALRRFRLPPYLSVEINRQVIAQSPNLAFVTTELTDRSEAEPDQQQGHPQEHIDHSIIPGSHWSLREYAVVRNGRSWAKMIVILGFTINQVNVERQSPS